MATKKSGLLFLTKGSLDLYLPDAPDIIHFAFPPNVVQDMDVINNQELINQIALFLQTNNITGVNFSILIYDDLIFGKEIKNTPIDQQVEVIKNFISSVPFEYTLIKEIKSKESVMIFATNSALIDSIIEGCQKNGNMVSYVSIGYFIFQGIDVTNGFTKQVGDEAMKKMEQTKEYSFIAQDKLAATNPAEQKTDEDLPFYKQKKNKRAMVLSGVFVALVGVLVGVYFIANKPAKKQLATTPPPAQTSQVASVSPTVPAPIDSVTMPTQVKIQVRTDNLQRFGKLQAALNNLNFQSVELNTKDVIVGAKTIVVFDPSVSANMQQNILEVVKTEEPDVISQINPVSQYNVIITLSKQ